MLDDYFKDPHTLATYRSGIASPYLDDFIIWLENRGYHRVTIRRHIREVGHFAAWATSEGLASRALGQAALTKFHRQLEERDSLRYPSGTDKHVYQSACIFVDFLESAGVVDRCTPQAPPQSPALFLEFREWMRTQRGTLDSTINTYRQPIADLLQSLGTEPKDFDARGLREFLLRRVGSSSKDKLKNFATAVRMFLRFLSARGYCAPGLEYAIPTVARWKLSSLPKFIAAEDVEQLINSCDHALPLGARDRAVLLLIARLGLRAGDVSALKIDDLLWAEGAVIVSGKNRRGTRLPLPQEVGDAVLHYLQHARPHVTSGFVFITAVAPYIPITRQVVGKTVARAISRTGINAPTHGAHLLRHSAATCMLQEGVSLPAISALLRHASIETTTVYAKVDAGLLQEVAMPWPEVRPC